MTNKCIAYCNGKGCGLRNHCRRYQEGQRVYNNRDDDAIQYLWMDNCDPENRDGFIKTTN